MNSTKVAIIGCGKQAPKHVSGLRHIPGIEIVLADSNPDTARALAERESLAWVANVDDVFADSGVDAVDICTPTPSHPVLIRSAIRSGKDFLCEKPLTERLDEARELTDLVARAGRIGMLGYIYRFAPIYELGHGLFKDLPHSGESMALGKVAVAHFRLGGRGSHQVWKHRRDHGGGAINEMLVHMVDLAIWYFGAVVDAQVLACDLLRSRRMIQGEVHDVDAEDYVLVRLKMESGVDVFCQADLLTPAFTQYAEIQGEYGTFVGSIQPHMPCYLQLDREIAGYHKGRNDFDFGSRNLFEAQMADFIHAVRSGKSPSRSTLEDSVLLMEAMEKVRQGRN